jgi:hypothetical protein
VRAPRCGAAWRSEATAWLRHAWAARRGHVARPVEQGRGKGLTTSRYSGRPGGLPHAVPQKVGWATSWRLARYTWSPHAARTRDGAVAWSSAARWWLASGKVLGLSTTAERWMRRARGAEAGQSGGSLRWRPHQREGRRCLRLAPGATWEDVRVAPN